tara:strand:+ start:736 stop:1269 length:534 start_codon:yes stop_codon:yes gene_type:complete
MRLHLLPRQPLRIPFPISRRQLPVAEIGRPSEVSSVNARKALISVFALAAMTLTSCGTLNRAGKDIMLGVGTPVLMVYGGATDGLTTSQNVREGMGSGAAVQVLSFPFTFAYHAFEHGVYGLVHLVDLPFCLFYGPAELHPAGPEVMPLDIYQGTWFDGDAKASTDAESGEMIPSGN